MDAGVENASLGNVGMSSRSTLDLAVAAQRLLASLPHQFLSLSKLLFPTSTVAFLASMKFQLFDGG